MSRIALLRALRQSQRRRRAPEPDPPGPELDEPADALTMTTTATNFSAILSGVGMFGFFEVVWGDGVTEPYMTPMMQDFWDVQIVHHYSAPGPHKLTVTGQLDLLHTFTCYGGELTQLSLRGRGFSNVIVPDNLLPRLNLYEDSVLSSVDCKRNPMTSLVLPPDLITPLTLDAVNMSLGAAGLDAVLVNLAAQEGLYAQSNGTALLAGNGRPGAAGLAALATLLGRGWTVTVDD